MNLLKKIFTALLILLIFNLYLPTLTFAEQAPTKQPLKIRATPPEDIPEIKEKKTSTWTWVLLVALIGGVAAAASGNGGDGGEPTPTTDTCATVSW